MSCEQLAQDSQSDDFYRLIGNTTHLILAFKYENRPLMLKTGVGLRSNHAQRKRHFHPSHT